MKVDRRYAEKRHNTQLNTAETASAATIFLGAAPRGVSRRFATQSR